MSARSKQAKEMAAALRAQLGLEIEIKYVSGSSWTLYWVDGPTYSEMQEIVSRAKRRFGLMRDRNVGLVRTYSNRAWAATAVRLGVNENATAGRFGGRVDDELHRTANPNQLRDPAHEPVVERLLAAYDHPQWMAKAIADNPALLSNPSTKWYRSAHGQRVGYARVSTTDQEPGRQLDALIDCDRVFIDEASGSTRDRPELRALLGHVRDGDEVIVTSMDRLARSLVDLHQLVDEFTSKGVTVTFLSPPMAFAPGRSEPFGGLLLGLLGAVAEFERALIRERQAAGIARARKAGKYKGRKRSLTTEQTDDVRARAAAGENRTALAAEFGVSRATLYNYLDTTKSDQTSTQPGPVNPGETVCSGN